MSESHKIWLTFPSSVLCKQGYPPDRALALSLGIPEMSTGGENICYIDPTADLNDQYFGYYVSTRAWNPIERKFDYWNRVLEATYADITYTERTLLYSQSSAVVMRQREKVLALKSVIDRLSELRCTPITQEVLDNLYLAELGLNQYADAFALEHEFGHFLFEAIDCCDWNYKKQHFRIRRDQLMRGRMLRRYFRRVLRDIRRLFRSLVRALFMHMNDQSKDDEFLVLVAICQPFIPSPPNWFFHGQKRNFSPH